MKWFKGNVHCHTTNSDGQLSPREVAHYYKDMGFDFLGISDHFVLTNPKEYSNPPDIFPIPNCEYAGPGLEHALALWVNKDHERLSASDFAPDEPIGNIFQKLINIIKANNGIPVLCHPFWHWTFDFEDIKNVTGWKHFELCNAAPDCNSIPIPGFSPGDEMWDKLLTSGKIVYGLATDDAHLYNVPYRPLASLGGRGFIVVKANQLKTDSLRFAIENGHFYATTGLELDEYSLTEEKISVKIKIVHEHIASFEFIGTDGKILQHSIGTNAEYKFTGNEIYVRIRILSTTGMVLWTQPIFLDNIREYMEWINA